MDQQILWTDVMLNPVDGQNLPGSPVFGSNANVPYIDLSSEDSADLSIWNSAGPSSSRHSLDQNSHEETKMEHGWASSLTINGNQVSRTEERQLETTNMLLGSRIEASRVETTNMLPMENMNLNLNSNQDDDSHSLSQIPTFSRTSDQITVNIGRSIPVLEAGQVSAPFMSGTSGSAHLSSSGGSSNLPGSSSRGLGFLSERIEGTPGNSFDGRRLSCKRKSIEGVSAQSSAGGNPSIYQGENSLHSVSVRQSANTTLSISSSSNYPSSGNPSAEQQNPRVATTLNVGTSDGHPQNAAVSTENSRRNCRVRINPPQHVTSSPNQWPSGNNLRSSDFWSTHQSSNPFIPFNQPLEPRIAVVGGSSDGQAPALPVPGLVPNMHLFPVNVASSSRSGSSSRSPAIAGQRSASREETSSRSLPRNTILEHSVTPPHADVRHLMQHSSNWSLAPSSQAAPTSQAGSSSRSVQSSGPTWIPHQNAPSQYQRRLPVVARRSLIPSGSGQSINIPAPPSGLSNTLQELNNQRAAILRSLQQMRSTSAILGDPSSVRSLATRESRSRVLSEIRNALARRGDHIEGVFLFDPAVLYGGAAELHDRHRDMRLDVDNMSYEELLALTERIGNVNTGLSEETILKCLKQRKYISLTEETPSEVEPCCVCQEEYVEEQDVGRLDCGHDFHTACIKKWLMMKNLCPICKTTGLSTSKER